MALHRDRLRAERIVDMARSAILGRVRRVGIAHGTAPIMVCRRRVGRLTPRG